MEYLRRPDLYRYHSEDTIAGIGNPNGFTYKDAGVDIAAGNRLVEIIKPHARSTARAGADAALGGFGGLFDLKSAGFDDPILVAATDGVGTKLEVAVSVGRHDTNGVDLVVQGAEPLFFLDYFATSALGLEMAGDAADRAVDELEKSGEQVFRIGHLAARENDPVVITGGAPA